MAFSKLSSLAERDWSHSRAAIGDHPNVGHHYDPNQPRVPAGHPDGGQWTRVGGGGADAEPDDAQIMSDVAPDNDWIPGAQYANRRRGGRVGSLPPTVDQEFRLGFAMDRAQKMVRAVRELDPWWRPTTSSVYQTIEGQIAAFQARAREAEARLFELRSNGIGPGRFGSEWIWARGPERDFTPAEREIINRAGYTFGCHTCGTKTPGTTYGNYIPDHQVPTALNLLGRLQRLYPHCVGCSSNQGLFIINNMGYGR